MRIILPASLPGIVDTLRIAFGWAWTYLVVAEIVAAGSGLGYMIMQSQRFANRQHYCRHSRHQRHYRHYDRRGVQARLLKALPLDRQRRRPLMDKLVIDNVSKVFTRQTPPGDVLSMPVFPYNPASSSRFSARPAAANRRS